jgi:hypothetical protein
MIFCLPGRKKVVGFLGIKKEILDYGPYIGGGSIGDYANTCARLLPASICGMID